MYSDTLDRRLAPSAFRSARAAPAVPGTIEPRWSRARYAARQRRGETLLGLGGTSLCYALLVAIVLGRWALTPPTPSSRPAPALAVFDVPPASPSARAAPAPADSRPKPTPPRQESAPTPPPLAIVRHADAAPSAPVAPAPSLPPDDTARASIEPPSTSAPARPAPAITPPTTGSIAAAERAARANWQGDLLAHLRPLLRYPRVAQRDGQQGVALLAIGVARDGTLRSVRIVRGSGYPLLDGEALATIRRGAPLPPPTPDIPGDPVLVELPIQFSLHG